MIMGSSSVVRHLRNYDSLGASARVQRGCGRFARSGWRANRYLRDGNPAAGDVEARIDQGRLLAE
jgi:hypothetical protein